jgi:hypothetical protein
MINFPNNPQINDTFTAANKIWQWDGIAWKIVPTLPFDTSEPPDWIRPADWLELDTPLDTEERFTALVAVYNRTENYCAFVAEGDYTVDWGDGTVEDYVAGATAYHQYNFSNVELDGTLTSEGFKQAILTITPQAENSLTLLDFGVEYPDIGTFLSGFKDIAFSGPSLETFSFANEEDPYMEFLDNSLDDRSYNITVDLNETFIATANQVEYTITKPTDYTQVTVTNATTGIYLSVYDYTVSSSGVITFTEGVLEEGAEYYVDSRAAGVIQDYVAEADQEVFGTGEAIYLEGFEVRNITTNTLLIQGTDYVAEPHPDLVGFGSGDITLNTPATLGDVYRIIAEVPGSAAYYRIPRLFYASNAFRTQNSFSSLEQIYVGANLVKNWTRRFINCVGLKNIARLDLSAAVSTEYMFSACDSLQKAKNLVISEIDNASYMFHDCKSLSYAHFTEFNACYAGRCFYDCNSLRYVKIDDFSKTINAEYMFDDCLSLQYVDLGDCSRLQTTYEMFYDARNLVTVNMTNLINLRYARWMFEYCFSLEYVDLSSTSSLLDASNMFVYNYNLKNVEIDTSKVINARRMFQYCSLFKELNQDFSSATNLRNIIEGNRGLTVVNFITSNRLRHIGSNRENGRLRTFNISNLTNTALYYEDEESYGTDELFIDNHSLENFPASVPTTNSTFRRTPITDTSRADISNSITLSGAFSECWKLKTITFTTGDLNSNLEDISSIFYGCTSLQEIPPLDFSNTNIIYADSAFEECRSLVRSQVTGLGKSHSYANCKLSASALNEIFTNLPVVTSESITVYGNPGVNQAGFDPTIATAKGWTVEN